MMPIDDDLFLDLPDSEDASGDGAMAYVRTVLASEVIAETSMPGMGEVDASTIWYAVHAEDGERLAVTDDRNLAFVMARRHDYAPVSAH
jgi:hypothetical protein